MDAVSTTSTVAFPSAFHTMCLALHDGTLSPWAMQTSPLERSIVRSRPFLCRSSSSLHPPICCHVEAVASEGRIGCFAGCHGAGLDWEWGGACSMGIWQRNQPGGKPPTPHLTPHTSHLTQRNTHVLSRTRQNPTVHLNRHFYSPEMDSFPVLGWAQVQRQTGSDAVEHVAFGDKPFAL